MILVHHHAQFLLEEMGVFQTFSLGWTATMMLKISSPKYPGLQV
jgi:hypothetical protein